VQQHLGESNEEENRNDEGRLEWRQFVQKVTKKQRGERIGECLDVGIFG